MAALIAGTERPGPPRLEGRDPVAGKDVPALYFGSTKMNNSFDLVDQVVREAGGAATLFVKSGDELVRVATNAKTGNGSRALGVLLDLKGPAIERIRRGEAYYGESFVQDNAYIAGYEPIRDASGEVIGIYATGYVKRERSDDTTSSAGIQLVGRFVILRHQAQMASRFCADCTELEQGVADLTIRAGFPRLVGVRYVEAPIQQ